MVQAEGGALSESLEGMYLTEQPYDSMFQYDSVYHTAVLFTGGDLEQCCQLQQEAYASAVVDTACTSTVCGSKWMGVNNAEREQYRA